MWLIKINPAMVAIRLVGDLLVQVVVGLVTWDGWRLHPTVLVRDIRNLLGGERVDMAIVAIVLGAVLVLRA